MRERLPLSIQIPVMVLALALFAIAMLAVWMFVAVPVLPYVDGFAREHPAATVTFLGLGFVAWIASLWLNREPWHGPGPRPGSIRDPNTPWRIPTMLWVTWAGLAIVGIGAWLGY